MEAQDKVTAEREEAEQALMDAFARLRRLRTQEKSLKERTAELTRRGMRDLDEADEVRSQEEALLAEQQAIGDLQSLGCADVIDWSACVLGPLVDPGSGGDTAVVSSGSASGVS